MTMIPADDDIDDLFDPEPPAGQDETADFDADDAHDTDAEEIAAGNGTDDSSHGPCSTCNGSGVDSAQNDDGYPQPCPTCGGTGWIG
jgi:hypothetical protein